MNDSSSRIWITNGLEVTVVLVNMPKKTCFIIAATPRSGSYLLCEGLRKSGALGYPNEYGNIEDTATWRDFHGYQTHIEYFHDFKRLCTSPNGICGVKLMWGQFVWLHQDIVRYLGAGDLKLPYELIDSFFSNVTYIWLLRRDTLRQAISLVRALQSNIWSQTSDVPEKAVIGHYDKEKIDGAFNKIKTDQLNWDSFFNKSEIQPFTIYYEDFMEDYSDTVAKIASWLDVGINMRQLSGPRTLRKQSDCVTDQWVEHYLLDVHKGQVGNTRPVQG